MPFTQISLKKGTTSEFRTAIAKRLQADPGVRPEDVVVSLVEVSKEDWSLGNGVAQHA